MAYLDILAGPAKHACLFGGARSGKTFLIVRAIMARALKAPGSRHGIFRLHANSAWIAMAGDANSTIYVVRRLCFPDEKFDLHRGDGYFQLDNGSTIWIGGLDDKERIDKILGREFSTIYLNEASEIPYQTAMTVLTRLAEVSEGIRPRAYVDLNPVGKTHWTNLLFNLKLNPENKQPITEPGNYASYRLNPIDNIKNLPPDFIQSLEALPEKKRKRFLEGVYVDEVEDALWTYDAIDNCRREGVGIASLARVVVAIDPSGAKSAADTAKDEIGIVVSALGIDGEGYVLADRTLRASPVEWARVAVSAYHEFQADCIVAEANFGGAMVEATLRSVDRMVPVRMVTASRGKAIRAEPVSALYSRGLVHHVGRFPQLEDQLCAFSSAGYQGPGSPDRADACIWGLTELMVKQARPEFVFG